MPRPTTQTARHPEPTGLVEMLARLEAQERRGLLFIHGANQEDWVSYARLLTDARRLLTRLRARGLGPGQELVIQTGDNRALLTIFWACVLGGLVPVPLAPARQAENRRKLWGVWPRLAQPWLAVDSGHWEHLSQHDPAETEAITARVIPVDALWAGLESEAQAQFPTAPPPEALALVQFSSGSTGRPKGVLIQQRGIVNFALWRREAQDFGPETVVLQLVPESFDGFGANLYPTLLAGASLVLINQDRWGDVAHIRQVLARWAVSHCAVVPSMHRLLLEGATPAELASLRRVTLAGERAPAGLLAASAALAPQARLDNEYGPTEDSVNSTALFGLTPETAGIIGRPITNHYALVLDDDLNLKPIGEPGELCLAGVGLARGYLNRPEETAARFIRNPFAAFCHGAERLYRTGDLARWLPDGNLELLGRLDQQVQVRGFRVEPQEIEARLLSHPQVRQAAVAARADEQGQTALWAWLSIEGELEPEDLRRHLLASLPEYMLPSVFLTAPTLPLNRHGKLDHAALESLEATRLGAGTYQAPRDGREEALARIWADKLGLERVGVHDNYFNLGGDSVKAISLLAAVNRELGCALKIPDLYEHKTVAELAQRIAQAADAPQSQTSQGAEDAVAALRQRILGR